MSFVKIASIEQGVDTFLSTPTNYAYKNISVNWAYDNTEGYLFQYGTMIAKRIGTIVWINKKFYSNTTSKLQNLIKIKAIEKGYRINEVEFMNDGGILEIKKGIFKGYNKIKSYVVIPLGISALKYGLENSMMPKLTVGFGIKLNSKIVLPYDCFQLGILKGEIVLLLTKEGQYRIKINVERNNYTLDYITKTVKETLLDYLQDKKYSNGGGISNDWSNPSYLSELDREDLKYVKFLYEQGEKELAYKTASDLDTIVRDEIPLSIWRDMGGKLTPVGEERLRKEQEDLSYASKTFSQSAEIKVKENLNNGIICINKLSRIIGKKPDYPFQIVGSIKLTKCFLKPYYRV